MRVYPDRSQQRAIRVGTAAVLIRHAVVPGTTVSGSPDPYHTMQGWRYENNTWHGLFRGGDIACPGEIWQSYNKFCARIGQLPRRIRFGRHVGCFVGDLFRRGWYRIHFAEMPQSVDGAILAVEHILAEKYR